MGWCGAIPPGSKLPFYPTHPWFLHTVLTKINIFHFGADSEKMMNFHFLLLSPVIFLLVRHLLFQKPPFPRLFRFGPPWGPNKKSIDPFWPPLGSTLPLPTLSGPSQDLPKNVQSEKWTIETTWGFTSKVKPWLRFANPGPPKKDPSGPDQLSRGLPEIQLGRPPHFWSPPWTLLESYWSHSQKKTRVSW